MSARVKMLLLGLCCTLACGSRTGLSPGRDSAEEPGPAECTVAAECPAPPSRTCRAQRCVDGACVIDAERVCDDGDPCTFDSCVDDTCVFRDDRVDADRDGFFAPGNSGDPAAALGCGADCDDASASVFPGAAELCDVVDNDCNGSVDDGTVLSPRATATVRVSPLAALSSSAAGLSFDGEGFGATMSTNVGTRQGQFRRLDASGRPISDAVPVARVNADSYGGPLVWTGQRYLTSYADARHGNYEVYLDVLNREGQRLFDDVRVTFAEDFSLSVALAFSGVEGLLLWEDRRFEGAGDSSALFGQRVTIDGQLLGENVRLSPAALYAQAPSMALSDSGIGIAFLSLEPDARTSLRVMTTSRAFERPSEPIALDFAEPDAPVVTAVGGNYVVTFHRFDGVTVGSDIFGAVFDAKGALVKGPTSMTRGSRHARRNATHSYGDRFVMVWSEDSDGPYQLYAQTFDANLLPRSARVRLTRTQADARDPVLAAASDGGLGVLYTDESSGSAQTFFLRLDCQSGQSVR
jgi:Putative metal-binding motif